MKYFFIRTNAISLLLAIRTANTKFFIFEQLLWMALVIDSRTAAFNGNIRTECVRKMNVLLETDGRESKNRQRFGRRMDFYWNNYFSIGPSMFVRSSADDRSIVRCQPKVAANRNSFFAQIFSSCAITSEWIEFDCIHRCHFHFR